MKFTNEQKWAFKSALRTWLQIKAEFEGSYMDSQLATRISVDADHSALLDRLLDGKEPLPEPPEKRNAYPVYPDD